MTVSLPPGGELRECPDGSQVIDYMPCPTTPPMTPAPVPQSDAPPNTEPGPGVTDAPTTNPPTIDPAAIDPVATEDIFAWFKKSAIEGVPNWTFVAVAVVSSCVCCMFLLVLLIAR